MKCKTIKRCQISNVELMKAFKLKGKYVDTKFTYKKLSLGYTGIEIIYEVPE